MPKPKWTFVDTISIEPSQPAVIRDGSFNRFRSAAAVPAETADQMLALGAIPTTTPQEIGTVHNFNDGRSFYIAGQISRAEFMGRVIHAGFDVTRFEPLPAYTRFYRIEPGEPQ